MITNNLRSRCRLTGIADDQGYFFSFPLLTLIQALRIFVINLIIGAKAADTPHKASSNSRLNIARASARTRR